MLTTSSLSRFPCALHNHPTASAGWGFVRGGWESLNEKTARRRFAGCVVSPSEFLKACSVWFDALTAVITQLGHAYLTSAAYIAEASNGKLSAPTVAGKAADAAGY
jgi:hypothetical protein